MLKDILTIRKRTENLLLLEVKPGSQMELIENGFDGSEKLFRLQTNGGQNSYTPFYGEELRAGNTFNCGPYGSTIASSEFSEQRRKIILVAISLGFKI